MGAPRRRPLLSPPCARRALTHSLPTRPPQITGVSGDFCSPLCVQNECPKGDGSFTAKPSCVLETQGSSKPTQCALICTPGSNGACPAGATCQAIQGEGICTYPSAASPVTHLAADWLSNATKTVSHAMIGCTPGYKDKTVAGAYSKDLTVGVAPSFTLAKGATYTYTAGYTMTKTVTAGQAVFKTTLSGLPIMNSKEDLCDSLADSPTPCPLTEGPVTSETTGSIPASTPTGTLESTVTYTDADGTQVLSFAICFKITS